MPSLSIIGRACLLRWQAGAPGRVARPVTDSAPPAASLDDLHQPAALARACAGAPLTCSCCDSVRFCAADRIAELAGGAPGVVARLVTDAAFRAAWLDDLRELAAFLRVRAHELDAPGAAALAAAAPEAVQAVSAAAALEMLEQVLSFPARVRGFQDTGCERHKNLAPPYVRPP